VNGMRVRLIGVSGRLLYFTVGVRHSAPCRIYVP